MPRSELRISGMLQAAVIALVLGAMFRNTPATAPSGAWPYVVGGYGFLAATAPWLLGGLDRSSFSLRLSAVLGLVFAAPLAISAYWLSSSPYPTMGTGCWVLVAFWGVHLATSIVTQFTRPAT